MNDKADNDEQLELMSLVLGELSPVEEAELRARVAVSAELQGQLDELEEALSLAARMPVESPPASMDDVIMAAARRRLEETTPSESGREGAWTRFVRFFSEAVNGPQAAMATITLLVVAVGLWFIPTAHRSAEERAAMLITDANHAPFEDEWPSLAPSEGANEPRRSPPGGATMGGIEDRRDGEAALDRSREPRAEPSPSKPAPSRAPAREAKRAAQSSAQPSTRAPAQIPAQPSSRAKRMAEVSSERSELAEAEIQEEIGDERVARSSAMAPQTTYGGGAKSEGASLPAASGAPSAADALDDTEPAPASRVPEAERLFRAGSYAAASELARAILAQPRPAESRSLPVVLDVAARSERARGRCAAAVPLYRRLLEQYPSHPRKSAALDELADCESRLEAR